MQELLFKLTTTAGEVTLANAPDGWDDSLINYDRSVDKYWGVFRAFSIPLKFVKSGAKALRTEFYTYGTAGVSNITIQRLNKVTLTYINAYIGKVDFSTYKDSDMYVECNLVDVGIAKILKDNGGTEYEVSARSYGGSSYISMYHGSELSASPYGGLNMTDLVKKLLDKMTDGGYTAKTYNSHSTILEGYEAGTNYNINPVIVCKGRTFREPGSAPQGNIKLTFENLFKSLVTWLGVGAGMEMMLDSRDGVIKETLVIEHKSFFLDNDAVSVALGNVKNISVSLNAKLMFNRVAIGFPAKEYTGHYATSEPNATSYWKSPNDTSTNELDLVSKFRADYIGILDLMETLDDASDDDIFFVELNWDINYSRWAINHFSLAKETGVLPLNEWYVGNAVMTPRRCFVANVGWLDCCLFGNVGDTLNFTKGDNNLYNLEVKRYSYSGFGAYMVERDPVTITAGLYFKPINIEFECALPDDMIYHLNNNTGSLISFIYEGDTYTGYVMSVKVKLSGIGSQKITLLSSAENDLTKLIR